MIRLFAAARGCSFCSHRQPRLLMTTDTTEHWRGSESDTLADSYVLHRSYETAAKSGHFLRPDWAQCM